MMCASGTHAHHVHAHHAGIAHLLQGSIQDKASHLLMLSTDHVVFTGQSVCHVIQIQVWPARQLCHQNPRRVVLVDGTCEAHIGEMDEGVTMDSRLRLQCDCRDGCFEAATAQASVRLFVFHKLSRSSVGVL